MDNESFLFIDIYGIKRWKNKKGELHRLDGPAVEYIDGAEEWYQNGYLHRLNWPAAIRNDGTKEWWQNGVLHRLDGPALETLNGHKQWYVGGKRSREDGPAIIYSDGIKRWYLDGFWFKSKEFYFDALSDEAKAKCLFSEDFLNG